LPNKHMLTDDYKPLGGLANPTVMKMCLNANLKTGPMCLVYSTLCN